MIDFDQTPGVDGRPTQRRVAHSFVGLPAQVAGAVLTLRVRAGENSGGEANDAVRIGFAEGGVFDQRWARFFGSGNAEPGLFDFVWHDFREEPRADRTIELDLAALPLADGGTFNLLPELAGRGYFDLFVGDDSGVDFMRLVGTGTDGRTFTYVGRGPRDVRVCGLDGAVEAVFTA